MCISVGMCRVYIWYMCTCVSILAHTYGGQKKTFGDSFIALHRIFLWQGLLLNLSHVILSRLASQGAPDICLSLPSTMGLYVYMTMHSLLPMELSPHFKVLKKHFKHIMPPKQNILILIIYYYFIWAFCLYVFIMAVPGRAETLLVSWGRDGDKSVSNEYSCGIFWIMGGQN